jgi:ferredoxin
MVQVPAATRWRFIVECQDLDSGSVHAVIGSADSREECESFASHEAEHQQDLYRHVINIEACELCRECDGDGAISREPRESVQCSTCRGHHGPFTRIKFLFKPRRSFQLGRSKAA